MAWLFDPTFINGVAIAILGVALILLCARVAGLEYEAKVLRSRALVSEARLDALDGGTTPRRDGPHQPIDLTISGGEVVEAKAAASSAGGSVSLIRRYRSGYAPWQSHDPAAGHEGGRGR